MSWMNRLAAGVVSCSIVEAGSVGTGDLDPARRAAPIPARVPQATEATTENVETASKTLGEHLRVGDRVGDILKHPAFRGFGDLLLPWDDRPYDPAMPLSSIGSLLPYHSHVDPAWSSRRSIA
jgi:hypothetical protein